MMYSYDPSMNVGALSIHQHESKTLEFKCDLRVVVHLAQAIPAERPTEQVTDQVSEQVKRLLDCLKSGPLSAQEAMECLVLKHRPRRAS